MPQPMDDAPRGNIPQTTKSKRKRTNPLIARQSMTSWKPDDSLQEAMDRMLSGAKEEHEKSRVVATFQNDLGKP